MVESAVFAGRHALYLEEPDFHKRKSLTVRDIRCHALIEHRPDTLRTVGELRPDDDQQEPTV
jgi:hypothetical protein